MKKEILSAKELSKKMVGKTSKYVMCMPYLGLLDLDDNLVGECFKCGAKVQFRPYNKTLGRKVCVECVEKMAKKGKEMEITTTKRNKEEALEILAREGGIGG